MGNLQLLSTNSLWSSILTYFDSKSLGEVFLEKRKPVQTACNSGSSDDELFENVMYLATREGSVASENWNSREEKSTDAAVTIDSSKVTAIRASNVKPVDNWEDLLEDEC